MIKIDDLKNSTVAIDVSIWIISSINSSLSLKKIHKSKLYFLTNFIKKILILLENEILPVFVFDGQTPALKRKEVLRRINEQMDNKKHAKIMAKSFLNGLLDKKFDKKDFKDLINDEDEVISIDEIFQFIFLNKQNNDIQLSKLQEGMLQEFLQLLLEKEFIDKQEQKQLLKCDNMQQVVQQLNDQLTFKLKNQRNSEIDHLDNTLKRFEINQLLRQINNKLKEKIKQFQGEQMLVDNQVKNIEQYQIQSIGKFQNDNQRKFMLLQKKNDNNQKQNFLIPGFQENKKNRNQNKKERMREILQRFNNVRQQKYNQQIRIKNYSQIPDSQQKIYIDNQNQKSEQQNTQQSNFFKYSKLESFFDNDMKSDSLSLQEEDKFNPLQFFEEQFKEETQKIKQNQKKKQLIIEQKQRNTTNIQKKKLKPTNLRYKYNKNKKRKFKKIKLPKNNKIQQEQTLQDLLQSQQNVLTLKTQQPKKLSLNDKEQLSINSEDQMDFLRQVEDNPLWDIQNYNFQINPRHLEQNTEQKKNLGRIQMDSFFVKNETNEIIQSILDNLGLPYIKAKEEAEAQCAYLQQNGIVDYIITEDSDIFLFGADSVIKNFGNFFFGKSQLQIVQMYDLKKYLNLKKHELILMAHLLGCDYCEGVRGIGVVNAFETIQNFNNLSDLKNLFYQWGQQRDDLIDKKSQNKLKFTKEQKQFLKEHKNYKKHWMFNEHFGNKKISNAFLNPKIKKIKNKKKFINLGKFQKEQFYNFLKQNFEFNQNQLDNMINNFENCLKKLQKQKINQYFKTKKIFTSEINIETKSQRLKRYIKKNN